MDVFELANQQRPNSKWVVMDITNATFYVTKLRDHPIGRSTRLPKYVLENPAIVSLDCNEHTGLPYKDKLCFFRCLALHRGCHPHNLERDTHHFYEQYSDAEEFDGVTLEELPELEKLFELNIYVYRLVELHDENEDKTEIVAQLIQRSHRTYANSMYLNLYGSHFSYIKNLRMYSKSYVVVNVTNCGNPRVLSIDTREHAKQLSVTFFPVVRTKFHKQSLTCSKMKVSRSLKT